MNMWLNTQRRLWRRVLSDPRSIGTIKLTTQCMVRDLGLLAFRFGMARMTVRRYLSAYEAALPLHTKRSPRPDDLRRLLMQGRELQRQDDSAVTQRLLLEPLTKLSGLLEEWDLQLALFETALERRYRLSARELATLTETCGARRQAGDMPDFVERTDALRQQVLASDPHLPATIQTGLVLAGNRLHQQIHELRLVAPADRKPAEWGLLVTLLLKRAETAEDALLDAIAALDQSLSLPSSAEMRTPENDGTRLLMWLSIVIATREKRAAIHDGSTAAVRQAVAQASNLDRRVLQPGLLFEALADAAPGGRRGRAALAWAVLSIDLLWNVAFAGGAELRRAVLDLAIESAATGEMERLDTTAAVKDLYRCLNQCEDMWTDAAMRRDLLRRFAGVLDMLKEPHRTILNACCHLAEDEEDAAEALFAAHRGPDVNAAFNGAGYITFLPSKNVDAVLDDPGGDPRFLAENCDFRIEKRVRASRYRMIAFTCADPVYVNRHFRRYADSFFRHDRRSILHLHVLGRPDLLDPDIRALIDRHGRIMLSSERPPVAMPYYYATARLLRAPLLQRKLRAAVMITDIDIGFRTSINRTYHRWLNSGDVGLRLYDKVRYYPLAEMVGFKAPHMETWSSINASCIYLGMSEPSRQFALGLSHVAHHALSTFQDSGNSNWWIDQNILYASLRPLTRRIEGLRLFNLLDVGIPFGAYQGDLESMPPPIGHRPGMPVLQERRMP